MQAQAVCIWNSSYLGTFLGFISVTSHKNDSQRFLVKLKLVGVQLTVSNCCKGIYKDHEFLGWKFIHRRDNWHSVNYKFLVWIQQIIQRVLFEITLSLMWKECFITSAVRHLKHCSDRSHEIETEELRRKWVSRICYFRQCNLNGRLSVLFITLDN